MNSILLYIYLGDISDNMSILFRVIAMLSTLLLFVFGFVAIIFRVMSKNTVLYGEHKKSKSEIYSNLRIARMFSLIFKRTVAIPIIFAALTVLVPSKFVWFGIAAEKTTEVALKTEIGQKVVQIVLTKLNSTLNEQNPLSYKDKEKND